MAGSAVHGRGGGKPCERVGEEMTAVDWLLRPTSTGRDLDLDPGAFAGPGVEGEVGAD